MNALQLRLEEPEAMMAAAHDYPENVQVFVLRQQYKAKIKQLEDELKKLEAELKPRILEGEMIGSDETGYLTLSDEIAKESFDYKAAMMDGLFTREQAKPYIKTTVYRQLQVKKPEDKNV